MSMIPNHLQLSMHEYSKTQYTIYDQSNEVDN